MPRTAKGNCGKAAKTEKKTVILNEVKDLIGFSPLRFLK